MSVRSVIGCAATMIAVTAGASACTAGDPVPAELESAFQARHPGESAVWERQPFGYEAVYSTGGVEYEVEFSHAGQWLETEYEVTRDDELPAAVVARVAREYPGLPVTKREIEQTADGEFYEVEVETSRGDVEVYFDGAGMLAANRNEDA